MSSASIVTATAIVTSPSIAAAISPRSTSEADSELVQLGAQFDELRDAIVAAEAEHNRILHPREAELRKLLKSGIAWEAARERLGDENAIPGFQEIQARLDALDGIVDPLMDSIAEIRPTTFAGIAVKLRVLRWVNVIDNEEVDANQDLDKRWFNIIDSDVRLLAGELSSTREAPIEPDPIFAAIGAQKRASWQLSKFYEIEESLRDDDTELEMLKMETDATDAFFRTRPSTSAGREALIRHAVKIIRTECCGDFEDRASFVTCGELIALLENLRLQHVHAIA
jgi:hypothetical protein